MIYLIAMCLLSFAPCPNKPNCVSSEASDEHFIQPFPILVNPEHDIALLSTLIQREPRTEILEQTPTYLHAIFKSKVFRFIDDVQFAYNPDKHLIEVKSAARSGYYDFGVNRSRIEDLREKYTR